MTTENNLFLKQGFRNFRKNKALGQNFLVNTGILEKILNAAELNKNDTVLEIGAGTGNLTQKLSEKIHRVIAVEKDPTLIKLLRENFKNANTDIVGGDILKIGTRVSRSLASGKYGYKIIGNIPYYITSRLLRKVFENWPRPKLIVLMVQKEVAHRILAKPPHVNLLALSVQFYSEPKIISYVSRGSFRPIPKVDSAIIRLEPRNYRLSTKDSRLSTIDPKQLFKLTKTAFAGKRKQLKNTIGLDILKNTGIKPESRPEELSLENWLKIAREV